MMTWRERLSYWACGIECWCSKPVPDGTQPPRPWIYIRVPTGPDNKPMRTIVIGGKLLYVPWYYEWRGEFCHRVSMHGLHPREDKTATEKAPCIYSQGAWRCANCNYNLQLTPEENLYSIPPNVWEEVGYIVGSHLAAPEGPSPPPWGNTPITLDTCDITNRELGGAKMAPRTQSRTGATCTHLLIKHINNEPWICNWRTQKPIMRIAELQPMQQEASNNGSPSHDC